MADPLQIIIDRVASILGSEPLSWAPVLGDFTPAAKYVAEVGGCRVFVKSARTPLTATILRREIHAYRTVSERVRPALLGADDGEPPILVIEDLGSAYWPPPWRDEHIARALAAIDRLHRTPACLPNYHAVHGDQPLGWRSIAHDPAPFVGLGITSHDWLTAALPSLLEAEAACSTTGVAAYHWDLRSDNMCFSVTGEAKLIDWAEACVSNPALDLGLWLPSLAFEGGPPTETILPHSAEIAAWVSGFFAARAGLPAIADAPRVRQVRRQQLSTALAWAQRALKLRRT